MFISLETKAGREEGGRNIAGLIYKVRRILEVSAMSCSRLNATVQVR